MVSATLDPVVGSEQAGTRPVLIVSQDAVNEALPIVAVLPLTTYRVGRRIYATEVLLPTNVAGQPNASLVLAHQFRTISKHQLLRSYGRLMDQDLRSQVAAAMRTYLDFE